MRVTQVYELRTARDVLRFCRALVKLKSEAPRSLTFTVAVTAEQAVQVVQPKGMKVNGSYLERSLERIG